MGPDPRRSDALILLEGVSKSFGTPGGGEARALAGLDLEVRRGETLSPATNRANGTATTDLAPLTNRSTNSPEFPCSTPSGRHRSDAGD